jgi:hypothetical protein
VTRFILILVACALVPLSAFAQQPPEMPPGHPPVGPLGAREEITDEEERADQENREERDEPGVPEEHLRQALAGETPEISSAGPSPEVPTGSIRVMVVDQHGDPVPAVDVELAVMHQDGERDRNRQPTDEAGLTIFGDLPTGSGQAYRINVYDGGARISSNPFQLPPDQGYHVSIIKLPTTRNAEAVLLMLHRTFLELRADRLHVVHQLQFVNLARETYVFPSEGLEVRLPEGATAFQTQEVMTDQRLVETDGGFELSGSLTPGRTTLVYAYDLELDGTELDFEVPIPFRTFAVRVEALASPDMRLEVDGMPAAEAHETDGHRLLLTEMQREPTDPPLDAIRIHLRGIEGPGPERFVAIGAALVFLVMGILFAYRGGAADPVHAARSRRLQKDELLAQAAELERMFETNEVGPKYRQKHMDIITTQLASLLREEEAAKSRDA